MISSSLLFQAALAMRSDQVTRVFFAVRCWKASKGDDCRTSLGSLLYYLAVLMVKKCFLLPSLNLSCLKSCSLSCIPPLQVGEGAFSISRMFLGVLKGNYEVQPWISPCRTSAPTHWSLWWLQFVLSVGPKTGCDGLDRAPWVLHRGNNPRWDVNSWAIG